MADVVLAINVLHVYKTCLPYTQGGIEEVIHQICRATTKLGVNNRIVCISRQCRKKEIIETPEAIVYCYPMSFEIASCGFSWGLWQEFKTLSDWANVIHYQFPWPFADILALTRQKRSTPYIVSYQSDIVRQQGLNKLYQPLMNKFLENATSVIATSPKYIASSPVLNSLSSPAILIPNGISDAPSSVSYQQERDEYYQAYGASFFLFIGVFRYYKGLKYLLEAAKQTGLPVVIVGEGPESGELHRYVQENKITNVHFLGHVNDEQKYALLDLAKALILPSSERSEAYGMVLLEAARQGTAMISTELGSGTSYINSHNETGLVVSAKNSKKLAEAMQHFTAEAECEDVIKMGRAAKLRFENYFTAEIMGKQYLKLYQTITSDN